MVWTRKAAFSCETFIVSLSGRETEPVTMQLSEPEVKTTMPSSHVKKAADFLDFMIPFFLTIMSTKPSMPPECSIR